jgi:hypothetical protein
MLIHGSCHCGNIGFELRWDPDPKEIVARACDCSFCTRHGGLWTSSPTAVLRVAVQDGTQVSTYSFGTGTALFHVCSRCGAVPVVTSQLDGHDYAVVSVTAFTDVDPGLIRRASASFEAESREERLARRKRNWIADVTFADGVSAR